jgi:threonine/homoserine/homoserine lactone efflux protein
MTAEFLVTSFLVALIPGTGVVYTISSAIGGGARRGLFAAVGCTLGILPHMAAAMLGLSGIMQTGATVFEAVRWAGVAYLVFIGLSMVRGGGAMSITGDSGATASPASVVRRGVLLNLLNPKLTLFFFAFLPQFLDADAGLLDARLIGLGGLFMAVTFVVFAGYAYVSAVFRDRVLGAPAVRRWVERTIGALLIGFAARLALGDR